MNTEKLQLIASTAWELIGIEGFGPLAKWDPTTNMWSISITGFSGNTMYHYEETLNPIEVEAEAGNTNAGYIKETIACLRSAKRDFRTEQLTQGLEI